MSYRVFLILADERRVDLGEFNSMDKANAKIADVMKNGHSVPISGGELRYPYWSIKRVQIMSQGRGV